jgi:hypothetical protein
VAAEIIFKNLICKLKGFIRSEFNSSKIQLTAANAECSICGNFIRAASGILKMRLAGFISRAAIKPRGHDLHALPIST